MKLIKFQSIKSNKSTGNDKNLQNNKYVFTKQYTIEQPVLSFNGNRTFCRQAKLVTAKPCKIKPINYAF